MNGYDHDPRRQPPRFPWRQALLAAAAVIGLCAVAACGLTALDGVYSALF